MCFWSYIHFAENIQFVFMAFFFLMLILYLCSFRNRRIMIHPVSAWNQRHGGILTLSRSPLNNLSCNYYFCLTESLFSMLLSRQFSIHYSPDHLAMKAVASEHDEGPQVCPEKSKCPLSKQNILHLDIKTFNDVIKHISTLQFLLGRHWQEVTSAMQ